ncbi:hypothetical protein [Streptomyces sp. NBC_01429]|uniref:hypothetical protein n=1 Tax=Streptomyces sp. NBC_01429 TaxID=2903862 RepID=UPI002E297FBD|nr:hypothetical protein [Streptomyces sp. NBC_01429]
MNDDTTFGVGDGPVADVSAQRQIERDNLAELVAEHESAHSAFSPQEIEAARAELRGAGEELLGAAGEGRAGEHRVATVRRENRRGAVVDAERPRHHLAQVCPSKAEAVAEAGGWSILLPGLPVSADGSMPRTGRTGSVPPLITGTTGLSCN